MRCEDCDHEFEPVYRKRQTKYCRVCQVLRTVLFIGTGARETCWLCDEEFVPLTKGQAVCPSCQPFKSKHSATGECGFCHETRDDLLGEDVAVCAPCAARPENRKLLAKALHAKQRERKASA